MMNAFVCWPNTRTGAEGQALLVEGILDAFLAPMLRVGLLHSGQGRLLMQLAGRLLQGSEGMLDKAAGSEFERVAVRFLAAFQKAMPLTKQEIAWRMNFTIGAAARTLFGGIPIRILSSASHEDLQERDVQRVLQRLIAYTAAGMKAPLGSQRIQSLNLRIDEKNEQTPNTLGICQAPL